MVTEFSPENPALARGALTVSQLNRAVAGVLTRGFPLVLVRGEIGNFSRAASGHWYFTLKDAAAQVRCVMFRGRNMLVDFAPQEGDEVELRATVTLYEARGEFQLGVESLSRAGLGRRYEEFLQLKNKLEAQGLFDAAVKRAVPAVPRRVGIVTSLAAAALRDVVTTLARRAPYVSMVVYPVPVQGAGAGAQIAAMLQRVSQRAEVDVVLLVRGGGSIEDLWAFNDEAVARALRASAIPVICGVGHESDITIADLAADVRAPTPTAAAELAAAAAADLADTLAHTHQRLRRRMRHELQQATQRLDYAVRALSVPRAAFKGLRVRVQALAARLQAQVNATLTERRHRVLALQSRLASIRSTWAAARHQVQWQHNALRSAYLQWLRNRQAHVRAQAQALEHLDPHQVLSRGYSLTRDAQGRVVRNASDLSPAAMLHTTFAQGAAVSVVQEIKAKGDAAA